MERAGLGNQRLEQHPKPAHNHHNIVGDLSDLSRFGKGLTFEAPKAAFRKMRGLLRRLKISILKIFSAGSFA